MGGKAKRFSYPQGEDEQVLSHESPLAHSSGAHGVKLSEKLERSESPDASHQSRAKRIKLEDAGNFKLQSNPASQGERRNGVAPIKPESVISSAFTIDSTRGSAAANDDAAEAAAHHEPSNAYSSTSGSTKRKERAKGQNTSRNFGSSRDQVGLCSTRTNKPELSPDECPFGDRCKFEHDLRKYLKEWKREDLTTFGAVCPVWDAKGSCDSGWKCRFVRSHMKERETEDGKKELVLLEKPTNGDVIKPGAMGSGSRTVNDVSTQSKTDLMKRKFRTPKADAWTHWLETREKYSNNRQAANSKNSAGDGVEDEEKESGNKIIDRQEQDENRACYTEPPLRPAEKRKVYFGPETPVLAPLTTQGNLPFRRLCVSLGAQITYSEMAMSLPLIQGQKSEWALMRAHESETTPPAYSSKGPIVGLYEKANDLKFGAQIAANKPWQAVKATEILTGLCPHLRVVDLNCGCPIDLVYRSGAGSALLDMQGKLEKILRGMNAVSGEVPITVKIRMGTKDGRPNALKLVDKLVYGGFESEDFGGGGPGVAAITLHGRSRQQRYTKRADWGYIADCAALVNEFNSQGDALVDTAKELDERAQPASGRVFFLGNGDCYSHVDYFDHIEKAKVDSVMVARGALIKPWIFEEIEKGQYLDKSATERLALVEQYVRYGLETWGSDEWGIGTTRRFLLEWLSFSHRYVPMGILAHLPPSLQDRPPTWRGRNELETLLGSANYRDWIKISEMFLGPAHKDFRFEPKHKSNNYDIEAEG
ncbi:MAG: hypothetical protein Q9214_003587 [Letrouitia sp. 1 TL-2023]